VGIPAVLLDVLLLMQEAVEVVDVKALFYMPPRE
jgi:hypothetical protein